MSLTAAHTKKGDSYQPPGSTRSGGRAEGRGAEVFFFRPRPVKTDDQVFKDPQLGPQKGCIPGQPSGVTRHQHLQVLHIQQRREGKPKRGISQRGWGGGDKHENQSDIRLLSPYLPSCVSYHCYLLNWKE